MAVYLAFFILIIFNVVDDDDDDECFARNQFLFQI